MRSTAARLALPTAVAILALLAVVAVAPSTGVAQQAENGTTTFGFDLQSDGDARVSVTTRLPLSDEADRAGFDRLAREHTSGSSSPLSVEPFRRAAALASQETGRQMEIRGISRTADQTNDTGQLTLAFTWGNFTEVDGERLLVGDAFRTPDGTWLPGLAADQELAITAPPGYSPQSITMPGTRYQLVNGTVHVEGPATFEPGTPSLVLQQTATTPVEPPWDRLVVPAGVLAVLAIAAFFVRGRLPWFREEEDGNEVITGSEDVEAADPMEEPLLSDEERVLRLLSNRNGRMKQVEIVEETDWSNAKVSQLLSEMEERGRIDKLRIGRENLISLPGQGPGEE